MNDIPMPNRHPSEPEPITLEIPVVPASEVPAFPPSRGRSAIVGGLEEADNAKDDKLPANYYETRHGKWLAKRLVPYVAFLALLVTVLALAIFYDWSASLFFIVVVLGTVDTYLIMRQRWIWKHHTVEVSARSGQIHFNEPRSFLFLVRGSSPDDVPLKSTVLVTETQTFFEYLLFRSSQSLRLKQPGDSIDNEDVTTRQKNGPNRWTDIKYVDKIRAIKRYHEQLQEAQMESSKQLAGTMAELNENIVRFLKAQDKPSASS